jgi:hypothetical protein
MPQPCTATVEVRHGQPHLIIDGGPIPPVLYALTDVPGGRWSWEEVPARNIRLFAGHGIALVQLDVFSDDLWREDGSIDPALAVRQIRGAIDAAPQARVMFRLHMNAPRWWLRRHPEEATAYADTDPEPDLDWGLNRPIEEDPGRPTRASLASARWLADAVGFIEGFCSALSALPEGDAVFGIQVAGGVYGEWHYWGFTGHEPDIGLAMQERFRRWRAARGLPPAELPGLAERQQRLAGIFRDPVREEAVIDYYRCQHAAVAEAIRAGCAAVKRAWPRPIIAGAFYGYFHSSFGRQAAGGHLEVQQVLRDPAVDFLCSPADYYPDSGATGHAYRSRGLITSCRLHGKLWLDEMDKRPQLHKDDDDAANLRRNVLWGQAHGGAGLWFYDFGPSGFATPAAGDDRSTIRHGWWDDRRLLAAIGEAIALRRRLLDRPYRSGADVLVVYDTATSYALNAYGQKGLGHFTDTFAHVGLFHSGCVHDEIHLDDLDRVDLAGYQAVVFMNAWVLTPAQRRIIRERVACAGRHLVWLGCPGFSDGSRLDAALVTEATGIAVVRCDADIVRRVEIDGLPGAPHILDAWGDQQIDPLLAVDDARAAVLGRFAGSSLAGCVRLAQADHTSWFLALPASTPACWRALLVAAGCHAYTDGVRDVVYAGGGIVCVHGREPGPRRITLRDGRVVVVRLGATGGTTAIDAETGAELA